MSAVEPPPGVVDLGRLRDQKQDQPRRPKPGERAPMTLTMIGQPGGPWAAVGDGGITIALGMGDETKTALLGMFNLAALAIRTCPTADVAAALDQAQLTIAAQAERAEADRREWAAQEAACERFHAGEPCKSGDNHPAAGPAISEA